MVLKLYTILLAVFLCITCYPNKRRIQFKHFTVEQGLSSSTIHTIIQDSEDYIWIGTEDGLNKFDGYNFTVYRHDVLDENSISGNSVHTILEDSKGLIWLGIFDGTLSCFNRETQKFTNYHPSNHPDSLNHIDVSAIVEDKLGKIWVATNGGGINIYDKQKQKFLKYNDIKPASAPVVDTSIFSMAVAPDGNIWIVSRSYSLNCIDPETLEGTEYTLPDSFHEERHLQQSKTVFVDSDTAVWIGSSFKGLWKLDKKNASFQLHCDPDHEICNTRVMKIVEERGKGMWFCTDGKGLFFRDKYSKKYIRYEKLAVPKHLSSNAIYSMLIDRDQNIWVGTFNSGLNFHAHNCNKFQLFQYQKGKENELNHSSVLSFCEFDDERIWIGTDGGGVNLFNYRTNNFENDFHLVRKINASFNRIAKSMYKDSKNRLWIGSYADGLLRVDLASGKIKHFKHNEKDKSSLADNNVWTIFEDSEGTIWLGMLWGGMDKYIEETSSFEHFQNNPYDHNSLPTNLVFDIDETDDQLWLATIAGGLVQFDKKTHEARFYKNNTSNSNSINSDDVICLFIDHKKTIWAGTKRGLTSYNSMTKMFTNYTTDNGLPSSFITGIEEDRTGNLWITTLNGITQFSPTKGSFKNFNINDGLQSNEFNQNAIYKVHNGLIFLGGINGFNIINTDSINFNYRKPRIVISEFRVYNQLYPLQKNKKGDTDYEINLNYKQNFISFEFAALDYAAPEKNKFSYKLKGFDDSFKNTNASKRYITYTNLDPGEYTLIIKGSNSDDIWNNKGVSVKINIRPPFWRTKWFIAGLVVILLILSHLIIRSRNIRLQKANEELSNKVRVRTLEIELQKEEIMKQRDEIVAQRDSIRQQRDEILIQQQDIMASIMYAKRLQSALLPPDKIIRQYFDEHFIFFKPKDIVSGDFYWLGMRDEKMILVTADCTGHGVPGAFMSVLGISYLTDMVSKLPNEYRANQILEQLNHYVVESLHQTDRFLSNKDGMDISLCVFDPNTHELQFAGANNSLVIVRNQEPIILKADRMPIGYSYSDRKEFNNHVVRLQKKDMIYMFSDGYADQFGGPSGKKYYSKRLKELFVEISELSMRDQKKVLNSTFKEWMGNEEQVDDVIIWGIRI